MFCRGFLSQLVNITANGPSFYLGVFYSLRGEVTGMQSGRKIPKSLSERWVRRSESWEHQQETQWGGGLGEAPHTRPRHTAAIRKTRPLPLVPHPTPETHPNYIGTLKSSASKRSLAYLHHLYDNLYSHLLRPRRQDISVLLRLEEWGACAGPAWDDSLWKFNRNFLYFVMFSWMFPLPRLKTNGTNVNHESSNGDYETPRAAEA